MNPKIEKLLSGLKTEPVDTITRAIRYLLEQAGTVFADILYYLMRAQLSIFPTRTLVKLKQAMRPTVKLDYPNRSILLHADSELSLFRAHACRKEPETVSWIEEYIKPGEVFYDVGANVGAYSLVASKFLGGQVKVYAFEPSFSTYYELCKNIFLNNCSQSIFPHLIGLSRFSGSTALNYHSLEIGASRHILGDDLGVAERPLRPVFRQSVLAFNVDDLISQFDFPVPNHIKLDVDGTELEILIGAERTLQNPAVKSLLVEVNLNNGQAERVKTFLSKFRFECFSKTARGGPYWNYIFSR